MKTKLTVMLLTLAALVIFGSQLRAGISAAVADNYVNNDYKGGSSFNLVGAGPNVARCGAFPANVELSFNGSGIDTEGGYNTAVFSACRKHYDESRLRPESDRYLCAIRRSGFYRGDPFVLEPNLAICTATNAHAVPFRVTGGTGGHAGATGHGHFHTTSNLRRVTA